MSVFCPFTNYAIPLPADFNSTKCFEWCAYTCGVCKSTFLDMVNPQKINKGKLYKWTCDQTIIATWTEIGHTVSASQVFWVPISVQNNSIKYSIKVIFSISTKWYFMVLSDFSIGTIWHKWYFQILISVLFGIIWYFQLFALVLCGI